MNERFEALYEGFVLRCAPHEIAGGWFSPRLVIEEAADEVLKAVEVPMRSAGPFKTQQEAADHAYAAGVRWVRRHHR